MFKQIVLVALAIVSVSANLSFTNCGGASAVNAFRIRGCSAVPCTFQRGQEYYGEMDVTKAVAANSMPYVIQAILGFPLPPVTIFDGDACNELVNDTCPTAVGRGVTPRLYMLIPTTLPAISTNVRATIRDHLNNIQVCVQIPVTLV